MHIQNRQKELVNYPWLDRTEYPFEHHFINLNAGRMHYVDEGSGDPILMVHGTPSWSFLYRHLIKALRDKYRVIAPDHLGFGLSDKPADWSYCPEDQARNLRVFIERLGLKNIALMVHDFGGPIGLSYALDQPDNVRRLVIFNTWMWSLKGERSVEMAGRLLGGAVGRSLYQRFAFSVNMLLPKLYGDRSKLTPAIHDHYRRPMDDPQARTATWVYARELLQSSGWYEELWSRRDRLSHISALLIWGMKDAAFGPAYLKRWQTVFPNAQTLIYPDAGHFVQEEVRDAPVPALRAFLG